MEHKSIPCRKAINFDLDMQLLDEYYCKAYKTSRATAYEKIRNYMQANGFEWRQGSGYNSINPLSTIDVNMIGYALGQKYPWLTKCIREIDVTNIGNTYSIKSIIEQGANNSLQSVSDFKNLTHFFMSEKEETSMNFNTETIYGKNGSQSCVVKIVDSTYCENFLYSPFGSYTASIIERLDNAQQICREHSISLSEAYIGINYDGKYKPDSAFVERIYVPIDKARYTELKNNSVLNNAEAVVNIADDSFEYHNGDIAFSVPLSKALQMNKDAEEQLILSNEQITFSDFDERLVKAFMEHSRDIQNEQQDNLIRVVVVEPELPAYEKLIPKGLDSYQSLVDGNIECIYWLEEQDAVIVGNDEARILGMEPNRQFGNRGDTILCGTFFIIGDDYEQGEFKSLTEEQTAHYIQRFSKPDVFTDKQKKDAHMCDIQFTSFGGNDTSIEDFLKELFGKQIVEQEHKGATKGGVHI